MKQFSKTLLASAVAVGLSSGAYAATISSPASGNTYAKDIVNESVRSVITPVATSITLGGGEALSIDDSVVFDLSGGATFAAIASGDLTGGGGTYALVSGGVGESTATFRVTGAPAAAATLTLAATATFNGAAVANNGDISVTATMRGFVGGIATDLFGSPLVSLAVDLVPMQTAAVTTAVSGIFDVAAGFQQLTAGSSSDVAPPYNSSNMATVTVTTDAAAVAGSTTAGAPVGAATPANTLFTLNGPMATVDDIDATNITSSTSSGGVPTDGTVATKLEVDVANSAAYGIATIAQAAGAGQAYMFTMNFDEDLVHEAASYSLDVTRTADAAGGYAATTVANGLGVFSFTRNGSAFTSNTIGPLNKISITDRSGAIGAGGADGAIAITTYDTAGNAVACSPAIDPLPNNGTVVFNGSDIIDSCPGAKRIEGIVNSTSIIVTNVKTTADGATATPARAVSGGTGAI